MIPNKAKRKSIINKLIILLINQKNQGYSLMEILVTVAILGLIGTFTAPLFKPNDSAADGYSQFKAILQQTRLRAISTTSAIRIKADPNQANKLIVEIANTRGCDAFTRLNADVASGDQVLPLLSVDGFEIGDDIAVGSDTTDNTIIAIDETNSTMTLGVAIDTNQTANTFVESISNWNPDSSLSGDYLSLPDQASLSANVTDWSVCYNSRGIATIYDNNRSEQSQIAFTISDAARGNSNPQTIQMVRGGSLQ